MEIRAIISPPWFDSFRLVYGEKEKVIDHYCRVFRALGCGPDGGARCQIRFVNKPLFSDTYKVDQHLITGPYLHNKTIFDGRITASDFFTYDLIRKSRLYELVEAENKTLWEEATLQLNWERFTEAYRDIRNGDYREAEKMAIIFRACDPVAAGQVQAEQTPALPTA